MFSLPTTGFAQWRDLVLNLVAKEVKLRHQGAALGFVWSLGNPIVVTLTYYVVFTYIMPSNQDRFALHLITGVLHWLLFSQLMTQSSEWLVNNHTIIKKMRFPRILIPASCILTVGVFWLVALAVYACLYHMLGGVINPAIAWYPVIVLSLISLTVGIGLVLSVVQVMVRDVKHLVDVFVPLLFWFTPIVWVTASLPSQVQAIVALNPIAPYFNAITLILHDGVSPSTGVLVYCVSVGLISLAIGLLTFRKVEQVVDYL
ncbi:ABC transporter permease [Pseudomonas aeruginosa]